MPRAAASARRQPSVGRLPTPNSAITPSPMNLSSCPPADSTRRPHRAEVPVEEKHDVIGQLVLGQSREGAQVGEQHGDLLLMALADSPGRGWASRGLAVGGSTGTTATFAVGRVWQARRTLGGAPTRSSTLRSASLAGGSRSSPSEMRTRQVEQRPRPPQTEACGMPADRLASRIVVPGWIVDRPPGRIADGDRAVADEPVTARRGRRSVLAEDHWRIRSGNQCSMA